MINFVGILPEFILAITFFALLLSQLTIGAERVRLYRWTAVLGLLTAAIQVLLFYGSEFIGVTTLGLSVTGLSQFSKIAILLFAVLVLVFEREPESDLASRTIERYSVLVLQALIGSVLVSSSSLNVWIIGIGLLGLLMLWAAGLDYRLASSSEAAFKHAGLFCLAWFFFVFGAILIYLKTGSLDGIQVREIILSQGVWDPTLTMGIFLCGVSMISALTGLLPLHLGLVDVLDGAPSRSTVLLAVIPRWIGFVLAIHWIYWLPGFTRSELWTWIGASALILGAALSFFQKSIRRSVSYLWLSEAGMLALALGAESTEAVALALILLLIQGFAFIGIFSTLSGLKSDSFGGATLNTHGLLWQQSWSVATILLSLGYLIGAPPLVSSWIKAGIWFNSANRAGYGVVLVSILALMLSFFGLMRLFRELSGHGLQKSTQGQKVRRKYPNAGEILLLFLLMLSTVFNDSLVGWAKVSLRGILW